MLEENIGDLGGSSIAFENVPKEKVPVLKQIHSEAHMHLFHEIVQEVWLASDPEDRKIDFTKIGQLIAAEAKYIDLKTNKKAYNDTPSVYTKDMPKWTTAVFQGPYKQHRKYLGLPSYHKYGDGFWRLNPNAKEPTASEKRARLSIVPKASGN